MTASTPALVSRAPVADSDAARTRAHADSLERTSTDSPHAHGVALHLGIADTAADADQAAALVRAVLATLAHRHPSFEVDCSELVTAPLGEGEHAAAAVRRALHTAATTSAARLRSPGRAEFDFSRNRVVVEGTVRALSFSEFEILRRLVAHECAAVTRPELLGHLNAASHERTASLRSIDVHIRRLRHKLEPYSGTIRTIRGVGYRFDSTDEIAITHGETTGSSP